MDDELLVHGEDRKRLKGAYKALFEEASAILFRHDPIGLDFETNFDEYDPEARTILPRLAACGSAQDVQRVVHEEFVAGLPQTWPVRRSGTRRLLANCGSSGRVTSTVGQRRSPTRRCGSCG